MMRFYGQKCEKAGADFSAPALQRTFVIIQLSPLCLLFSLCPLHQFLHK